MNYVEEAKEKGKYTQNRSTREGKEMSILLRTEKSLSTEDEEKN